MGHIHIPPAKVTLRDYVPLLIVVSGILIATLLTCFFTDFRLIHLLGFSMGYFFLTFGTFKVADLKMFAMGYAEYDLLTKKVRAWGYVYPFVELTLAALYFVMPTDKILLAVTLILSLITVTSVGIKLSKHETIHCVCLGNLLKVPLTYVSLAEYGLMGLMALAMFSV